MDAHAVVGARHACFRAAIEWRPELWLQYKLKVSSGAGDCCHPKHMLRLDGVLNSGMWKRFQGPSHTQINGASISFSTVWALICFDMLNAWPPRFLGCDWPFCRLNLTSCIVQVTQEIGFNISMCYSMRWWGTQPARAVEDCSIYPWQHVGGKMALCFEGPDTPSNLIVILISDNYAGTDVCSLVIGTSSN